MSNLGQRYFIEVPPLPPKSLLLVMLALLTLSFSPFFSCLLLATDRALVLNAGPDAVIGALAAAHRDVGELHHIHFREGHTSAGADPREVELFVEKDDGEGEVVRGLAPVREAVGVVVARSADCATEIDGDIKRQGTNVSIDLDVHEESNVGLQVVITSTVWSGCLDVCVCPHGWVSVCVGMRVREQGSASDLPTYLDWALVDSIVQLRDGNMVRGPSCELR